MFIRVTSSVLFSLLVLCSLPAVDQLLAQGEVSFRGTRGDFESGPNPSSVAVGDFNGDGKPDLAVANTGLPLLSFGSSVSILLGTGDGRFGAVQHFSVGRGATSIAAADFNGDGKLDLAVTNAGTVDRPDNTVSILLGMGDGRFGAAQNFGVGGLPSSVAVGDFNGDGKLDLAVANYGSGNVSILLGTGDGRFGAAQNFRVGSNPRTIIIGDFNGDGKLDLAIANEGSCCPHPGTVSILINTTPSPLK